MERSQWTARLQTRIEFFILPGNIASHFGILATYSLYPGQVWERFAEEYEVF